MHIANYWPKNSYPANYWPDWPPQVVEVDGLSVAVAIGSATVYIPGEVLDIAPEGYELVLVLGEITVTRRPAAVIPLYEIDLDVRTWRVPAESRVYVAEA